MDIALHEFAAQPGVLLAGACLRQPSVAPVPPAARQLRVSAVNLTLPLHENQSSCSGCLNVAYNSSDR
jgi:hypothetical protein